MGCYSLRENSKIDVKQGKAKVTSIKKARLRTGLSFAGSIAGKFRLY